MYRLEDRQKLLKEADEYAKSNVKYPRFERSLYRWVVSYKLNEEWTYQTSMFPTEALNIYKRILEKVKSDYIQNHSK